MSDELQNLVNFLKGKAHELNVDSLTGIDERTKMYARYMQGEADAFSLAAKWIKDIVNGNK